MTSELDLPSSLRERVVARRTLPARPARTVALPAAVPAALRRCLEERGIERLYTHQAEMFERAQAGEDVVVTTGTASGKSLGFLLPVLSAVLADPAARALLIYPTKALAHDQLRGVLALADALRAGGEHALEAGVYDGDTSPVERKRLRERANLVLTNPDMLNAGLLPAHGRPGYSHLFRNVRFVVLDELHVYRGAFGSHVANVIRRLVRVCRHYGSEPRFLCSSATIANPGELAARVCQRPVSVVDDDGSPAPGKTIHFYQPPLEADGTRRPAGREVAHLLPHLIKQRQKSIAFCRSRKETEVVLKEARDHLASVDGGHDEAALLGAYRGGYKPEERRRIERDLLEGRLVGVVSTNALELGVDIGQLEVVVQAGFPGTRASFWQQLGRAGRRGREAHGLLVLAAEPVDQLLAGDPDWLVGQPTEQAVLDPDNLTIQLAHARAAAAELPLTLDDAAWFPDLGEVLPVLQEAGEVREVFGAWHWSGPPFPAGDFSLRATDGDRFKVVDRTRDLVLTEMTRPQVYKEAHPRAVYLHGGEEFLVEELDLVGHRALCVPAAQSFYTQPDVRTQLEVLVTQRRAALPRTQAWFGDVRALETVVGYKMLEFHNHQNLGYERLHQPLSTRLETEAVWVAIPEPVLEALGERRRDALQGVVHALRAVARLATLAERQDLIGTSFPFAGPEGEGPGTAVALYDHHPGGLGFAARAFEQLPALIEQAARLAEGCRCGEGCPACTGGSARSRSLIGWALRSLLEETPPPAGVHLTRAPASAPQETAPPEPARVPFAELPARWGEVQAALAVCRETGAELLRRTAVSRRGERLILEVAGPGLVRWLEGDPAQRALRALIERHVACPPSWRLAAEVPEERGPEAERARHELRRRHEDLLRGEAETERAASAKLAGGFVLREP